MKRLLSLLLSMALAMSLVPAAGFAEEKPAHETSATWEDAVTSQPNGFAIDTGNRLF